MKLMMQVTNNRKCKQRGVAAVEFAIILPVLLLLMLATAEIGRLLYQYNTLTKAVRDGARHASRPIVDSTGIVKVNAQLISDVKNLVVYGKKQGGGTPLLPGFSAGDIDVFTDTTKGYIIQ